MEVALFKSYELPSDKGLDNIKTTIQFDEIKDIDYEHLFRLSEMLASESVMNEVRLETNTNYWISRYMLNPQTPYLLYALSKCGVPIGYMVTKRYKNNGNCYSHIVDYILSDNSYMDDVISTYWNNKNYTYTYNYYINVTIFPFGKEILYLNEVLRNPDLLKPDLKPF
jgi:hypothetical protein